MVVHIDTLILENILVNYFLLYITSQTVRIKIEFRKIIIPSIIGGLYVLTIVFPSLRFFTVFPIKILVAFIMILILFRDMNILFNLKASAIYIMYSMLLAGLCVFIEISGNSVLQVKSININFSYKKLLLCVIIIYLFINRIITYIRDRKELQSLIYEIDIVGKDKEKSIMAFLDTGNELREPATNLPVIIIEKDYILDFKINEKDKLYIPYKVVNGQVGSLIGFKPECVIIHCGRETKKREAVIAVCENKLSDYSDYHALLSRGIIWFWRGIMFRLKVVLNRILFKLKIFVKRLYYIGGNDALPPPLSKEEEDDLVAKLLEGDESIRSILIERNLRLVVYIARKFENTGVNVEDLISVGTIGLIKAVNTFDPNKKIKLATYGSRCIENEILMYLRRNSKVKAEISFYEPLNIDWDGNELLLSDILGTDNDVVYNLIEDEVDKQLLLMAMNKLNSREKEIVELRFGLNGEGEKTQKEVADMLGISQSYISRLEKRIIKRLKKEINKMI